MENSLGKGTTVLVSYEASKMCFKPDNIRAENMLVNYSLGSFSSPYICKEAITYRLASPKADHYFIINDGNGQIKVYLNFKKL